MKTDNTRTIMNGLKDLKLVGNLVDFPRFIIFGGVLRRIFSNTLNTFEGKAPDIDIIVEEKGLVKVLSQLSELSNKKGRINIKFKEYEKAEDYLLKGVFALDIGGAPLDVLVVEDISEYLEFLQEHIDVEANSLYLDSFDNFQIRTFSNKTKERVLRDLENKITYIVQKDIPEYRVMKLENEGFRVEEKEIVNKKPKEELKNLTDILSSIVESSSKNAKYEDDVYSY